MRWTTPLSVLLRQPFSSSMFCGHASWIRCSANFTNTLPSAVHVCDGAAVVSLASCLQSASKDKSTLDWLFKLITIKEHLLWDYGIQIHQKSSTTYYSCPLMKTPALRAGAHAQLTTAPSLTNLDLTLEHFRKAEGKELITPVKAVSRAIPDVKFGGMGSIPTDLQDRNAAQAHEYLVDLLSRVAEETPS
ncbi:hypothetical protein CBOM_01921 [Ceraceosorus bombacis]|uniref:Uncharacterized protein n=1 Tax=Ceraceosorus bombacis TaxID=401625 RepID=A0A0P1BF01_9BASI|nr:hypothetical protein CBOM_01921 [Ceraceosorus bombacis]